MSTPSRADRRPIATKEDGTEVRFTHVGLRPDHECDETCARGGATCIETSLRSLLTTGKGVPNRNEQGQAQRPTAWRPLRQPGVA